MKKVKNRGGLRFKYYYGITTLATSDGIASTLMTSLFLLYLTDYSGLGKMGAVLGGTVLLFARIFDAVNDPLEGWIMDRAKVGKHGKYRPFVLLSIILTAVGTIGLFSIPTGLSSNIVVFGAWVIIFYLIYDMGAAFYAQEPLLRTLTLDAGQRGKLMIGPRMLNMLIGVLGSSLIAIISGINQNFNNMQTAFTVTITAIAIGGAIISITGLALLKEKYHAPVEETDKVRITDIFGMIRTNDALRVRLIENIFNGFIWTFLFTTSGYYFKWAYCADLATGAVDTDKFGLLSMFISLIMFLPLILGTFIGTPLMKKAGSPIKLHRILLLLQVIPCLAVFAMEFVGVLRMSPAPFLICLAIAASAFGADFVPSAVINLECMDYEIYKNGRDRSALCNACFKFLNKAQSAAVTSLLSILMVAIGYEVDSVTDTFIGELSAIPTMLSWFGVIMGLLPGVLGLVAVFVLNKYPVTDSVRADMNAKLSKSEEV